VTQHTFWLLNSSAATYFWGDLQVDGSAPGAAAGYGWVVGTLTPTKYCLFKMNNHRPSADFGGSSGLAASTGPVTGGSTADSYRSTTTINDTLDAGFGGKWAFKLGIMSTIAGTQQGHFQVRVWASTHADGSSPRELTSGPVAGSTCAPLSLSYTSFPAPIVWTAPTITLTNEYLFFQLEWVVDNAGGGAGDDVGFYISTSSVVTPSGNLSIDGAQPGTATSNNVVSAAALTTVQAGDIIIAYVYAEWAQSVGAAGSVSGISGGGLTWNKRASQSLFGQGQSTNSDYSDLELWWAYAPTALSSVTITATFTKPGGNNFDAAAINVFGVTGFFGTTYSLNPWDSHISLPATGTLAFAAANPACVLSTSNARTMVIGAAGASLASLDFNSAYLEAGYTGIVSGTVVGPTNIATCSVQFRNFATVQTNLTVDYSDAGTEGWIFIGDALSVFGAVAPPFVADFEFWQSAPARASEGPPLKGLASGVLAGYPSAPAPPIIPNLPYWRTIPSQPSAGPPLDGLSNQILMGYPNNPANTYALQQTSFEYWGGVPTVTPQPIPPRGSPNFELGLPIVTGIPTMPNYLYWQGVLNQIPQPVTPTPNFDSSYNVPVPSGTFKTALIVEQLQFPAVFQVVAATIGRGQFVLDAIGLHDTNSYALQVLRTITEVIKLQQTGPLKSIYKYSFHNSIALHINLAAAHPALLSSGIGLHGSVIARIVALIMEHLGLHDVLIPKGKYHLTIAQVLRIHDFAVWAIGALVTEGMHLHASVSPQAIFQPVVTSTVGVHDTLTGHRLAICVINEHVDVTDAEILKQIIRGTIQDGFVFSAAYVSPDGNFTSWAINTNTGAITEYQNWVFDSFAQLPDGTYIATGPGGLYELDGTTDAGAAILGDFKSGMAQVGGSHFSSFKNAYLGMRTATGDVILKLISGDGKVRTYKVTPSSMKTTKINFGKGLRARYFAFELIATGPFDFDSIEFVPIVTQRRAE